uniref:Myoferlin-like n=1 Tax=Sinocyclocheilus anshuiensis TaxID=1608454 RepID=A0A671LWU1_9TELE
KELAAVGEEEKGVDSDENAGDVAEPGAPGVSPSGQPKKMVRTTRKRQRTLANKPQDFQIRIRVIEGRQLPGNNIKPVVKVSVCGQTHRTRIRRGNNPFFDEVFWFLMCPSDFLDVGYVYDEPGHAIMRKWLLLSDPDDSISGARGYLNVSMFIVGTGDEPPVIVLLIYWSSQRTSNQFLFLFFSVDTTESEVGFLPAFGPCYVNLYGSPREFTVCVFQGEGVAYRGRVLIETVLKIIVLRTFTVQKYQRRRKYSLCAVFHSACMLQEPGEPIQFEVSIGNYGNKLDSTCKPLASTTQFSCAVFDGNRYYYLPWADSKPVVILTSFWEDISHRLDAVNIILYISDRLVRFECIFMPWSIQIKNSEQSHIFYQLPDLEGKPNLTALDIQIKNLRGKTMASVKEAAIRMREEAVDVRATMPDIEDWLERLQQITEEPQNSMPDVIIWMLRGEKRVAYTRIPANQVLYSTHSEQAVGKYCGRMQSIFMQYPMDKNKGLKIPVQLRVNMWLGLSAHEKNFNSFAEGTFSVYAEMYENQAQVFGKWGTTGLVGRHKFSDLTGKVKLKQERFMPPRSWEWEGDWLIDPERWEYGVTIPPDDKPRSWVAAEKMYHIHRRKRLVRPRRKISDTPTTEVRPPHYCYVLIFNPYVHVSFLHVSKTTEIVKSSLNPIWDQTLIFDDIEIYGDPQTIAHNPPSVVLEVYDNDQVGKDELMGRCMCPPVVKLNSATPLTPKLLWFPITMKGRNAGEMLVAAELLLKDKVVYILTCHNLYMVPQGIRPVVQLTAVEILAWGLRNMKAYQLAAVSSPSLIVECGGQTVQTAIIKNIKKNPNFPGSVLFLKVLLPKDEIYTPPIVLKVIDHRPFGRKPVVGQCTINSLEEFRCDPYISTTEVAMSAKEDTVDWWSKFFASINKHEKCGPYLQKGYDTLTVFNTELEAVPEFRGLTDFCTTFKLQRGKTEDEEEDPSVVGEFKGSFRVYPLSDDPNVSDPPRQFRELPESCPQECLVRIYIIRCLDLQPKDNNGMCDPYIKISLGKKMIDDRDHYKPNTLNPEFGRVFELNGYIPQDKDLKISIYDYDLLSADEKVGETIIDLENRLLSRFGSHCGIPKSYCVSGVNQWRDQLKPSQILQNLARMRGTPAPQIADDGSFLSFGGREYRLDELEANKTIHPHLGPPKERICLHVLRRQGLVPEHVETRTLYSSYQPTLSQGKIQMWVEIFPKSLGIPGPLRDITPRKPKKYFLRVIVWNTTEVILDETSITGENMSDIYVKGWMPGMEEDKQKTDVHFRSLDGDGNFNWRFVFGFDYLPAEQLCMVSRKEHFWNLDKTEFRIPPKLIIQVWDNDKFSLDDYLGTVELDMLHLIPPAKTPEKCSLSMLTQTGKNLTPTSLFSQKSVRGWWPCAMEEDGKKILAVSGKVEMTLEVLEEKEAEERPAGKGRDEPNMNPKLDPPNRPDTSFLWFTNPCKTMKFIIWRRYKWLFIGLILLILVILFIGILLYSFPVSLFQILLLVNEQIIISKVPVRITMSCAFSKFTLLFSQNYISMKIVKPY